MPSQTLNNVRRTFPLITLTSCKTTVPLMKIAVRHRQGRASMEDLRQAMIYYRSLFEDLLDGRKPGGVREVA